jgi:hypothetical protein
LEVRILNISSFFPDVYDPEKQKQKFEVPIKKKTKAQFRTTD